jgi:hypothetical protein
MIDNSKSFYIKYHFHNGKLQDGSGPTGSEVTCVYNGSNNAYDAVGITLGVDGDGKILRRTEDHYVENGHQRAKGDYNEFTTKGTPIGGVSHIPELSPPQSPDGTSNKDFDIIVAGDKDDKTGNVTYRGYVRTQDGKEYQIANLVNPKAGGGDSGDNSSNIRQDHSRQGSKDIIDFTNGAHNTYARGRVNRHGVSPPTGHLFRDHYDPDQGVIIEDK